MEKIVLGKKFSDIKHDFRETCFGICVKDDNILLTYKSNKNEYSLPGGGIELGENHNDCLKREFLEETGYALHSINELVIIDCFWLAGNVCPMESLTNIYIVCVGEKFKPSEQFCEEVWVNINQAKNLLQLPYQKKALEYYLNSLK